MAINICNTLADIQFKSVSKKFYIAQFDLYTGLNKII